MSGEGQPPPPDPASTGSDLLRDVMKLARQQGALEGEDLEAFVKGLCERADRVIAERLERAETKLRVLRRENEWRKDAMAALEEEKAWLRETIGNLEAEATRRRGAMDDASAAHDSLLGHHRGLTARLADQLGDIASLPVLRAYEVRRRLRSLADSLRAETR